MSLTETTTQLNAPVSPGDKMDERQVTQADGVTVADRPVVVIAGPRGYDPTTAEFDDVQTVNADPGESAYALPTLGMGLVNDTPQGYVAGEVRPISITTEGRIRVSSSTALTYLDMFGDTSPIDCDSESCDITDVPNPWF